MKYIKTIVRIMMCVIKCSPVAAVIGILCSLGFALCTAWGAGILAGLFTQAELLAVGVESKILYHCRLFTLVLLPLEEC